MTGNGDEYDPDAGPDPTDYAAAAAEPTDKDVHDVVGIGPGNPAYLVSRAEEALRTADVIVGFETVVDLVRDRTDADLLTCGYRDETTAPIDFADRVADGERGAAVLMGDPNHSGYQFVGNVERAVDEATEESIDLRVVPGI